MIVSLAAQLAGTVDVFPTVMSLAGGKLPNVTMDGVDMAPILFDNKKVTVHACVSTSVYFSFSNTYQESNVSTMF